ncbi:hypothetical protein Chor_006369 [Crotalus horridus]
MGSLNIVCFIGKNDGFNPEVLSVLLRKFGHEVESLEDKLTLCRQALEEVDFKLRREELTSARRESLEKEKNMLETKAEIYEKELKMLRHENRKTVVLSAAIILLVFVIYTCWTM